jgi:hypothetical protein
MTENFDDILAFDPSQLSVNNPQETQRSAGNMNIYKPKPADAKSEDGIYRSQIKVIYNPFDLRRSVLEQQSYAIQDANGWFTVVSSLTNNDTNCPLFKAWKTCHYSKDENLQNQAKTVKDGGKGLFDKRYARYVIIQVLDDQNNPDLNGKYMFWKMPKAVWEVINQKQSPTNPAKASIPVMDFLFGRAIDLEVKPGPGKPGDERYTRVTSYSAELTDDVVSCVNPDMSPLLNSTQQAVLDKYFEDMKKVWKEKDPATRLELKAQVDASDNTKTLRTFYREVIEAIKKVCPNLIEELGYKEWNPETAARVQKWIDIVLAGNDPTAVAPKAAEEAGNTTTTSTATPVPDPMTTDPDDDLPF